MNLTFVFWTLFDVLTEIWKSTASYVFADDFEMMTMKLEHLYKEYDQRVNSKKTVFMNTTLFSHLL